MSKTFIIQDKTSSIYLITIQKLDLNLFMKYVNQKKCINQKKSLKSIQ